MKNNKYYYYYYYYYHHHNYTYNDYSGPVVQRVDWTIQQTNHKPMVSTFSNSLIIHEDKTKEITTMKAVWISDPNIFCFEFLQELLMF